MKLEERIKGAIKEYQSIILAKRYLIKLDEKIKETSKIIDTESEEIEKKYEDIKQLENLTINSLFRRILGDKKEQLEFGRQEYLKAVLRYRDAEKQRALLAFERRVIFGKVKNLDLKKEELLKLILEREQEITKNDKKYHSSYLEIFNELDTKQKLLEEIIEAKSVGEQSKEMVFRLIEKLEHASELRDWGFEKGIMDYSHEKSIVDESVELFHVLKVKLLRFEDELDDVYEQKKIQSLDEIHRFESLIDVYYNYLINDWIIRGRISSVINMMQALKDEVVKLLLTLNQEKLNLEEVIVNIEKEKEKLILTEKS